MSQHHVEMGIDVTYSDGSEEHVACGIWWLGNGVLHTDRVATISHGWGRGPSFPLVGIRKWQETA